MNRWRQRSVASPLARAQWPSGFTPLCREAACGAELRWTDVFFTPFLGAPTFSRGSMKSREPRNPTCHGRPRWLPVPAPGSEEPQPAVGTYAWVAPWPRPHSAVRSGDRSWLFCLLHAEPSPGAMLLGKLESVCPCAQTARRVRSAARAAGAV